LRRQYLPSHYINSQHFVVPVGSLPCWQNPAMDSYPQSDEYSEMVIFYFFEIYLNIIPTSKLPNGVYSIGFYVNVFVRISLPCMLPILSSII
jgi:hypothetical protein